MTRPSDNHSVLRDAADPPPWPLCGRSVHRQDLEPMLGEAPLDGATLILSLGGGARVFGYPSAFSQISQKAAAWSTAAALLRN